MERGDEATGGDARRRLSCVLEVPCRRVPSYTSHLETHAGKRQRLILVPDVAEGPKRETEIGARTSAAAIWALTLDVQYADLLRAGKTLRIDIPPPLRWSFGRPSRQTLAAYRALRLSVGQLISPPLRDKPEFSDLYSFQSEGVAWLSSRNGGLLADDMGLGKTVQVIGAMRLLFHRAEIRTAIVACPKTLLATWEREFGRWAPELSVALVTPTARIREQAWGTVFGRRHILLTTYEQLREIPSVVIEKPPDLFVADEAHRLRKSTSQTTVRALLLRPRRFWAVTGTPVERDLEDLTTLLSLVAPERFSPAGAKYHTTVIRSLARPFVLRRRKKDVLDALPRVNEYTETIELTSAQTQAYKRAIAHHRRRGQQGDELALLTRLQGICDMDPDSGTSSKVERVVSLLGRVRSRGEKAVVFSYRLDVLRELARRVSSRWDTQSSVLLLGQMSQEERDRAVVQFRRSSDVFALLASARVGGEGLTLVEANHVVLVNRWWNPSANAQARDRVVRIGQRREVHVYRFCCRGTVEESVERILESKDALVTDTIERLAEGERGAWAWALRQVGLNSLLGTTAGAATPS